jgi:hypothetical protein
MNSTEQTGSGLGGSAKQAAADARERLREQGGRLADTARERAEEESRRRRDDVADYLHDLADAFGSATATLEERQRKGAAYCTRRVGDEIGRMGNRVEGQDVGHFFSEVEGFARRRPALFFGGAFLLGYGLTLMLAQPAREEARAEDDDTDDLGRSYGARHGGGLHDVDPAPGGYGTGSPAASLDNELDRGAPGSGRAPLGGGY